MSSVEAAAVTTPTAPRLNETLLAEGDDASKFCPAIWMYCELTESAAVLCATTGGARTGVATMMSPSSGVRGRPVAGSIGSDESGAAATVNLWADRPTAGGGGADSFLRPEAPPTAGSGAHPTPTEVTM